MKRRAALAIAALCLSLAACDSLPGRPKPDAQAGAPATAAAFDRLYAKNCAGCHGAGGRLGAARPLNDPVYLALLTADRLRTIAGDGVPGTSMPAFKTSAGGPLTDAQIDALAKGMFARWGRPDAVKDLALPPYQAEAGMPSSGERGADVYARACARCHGPDGTGGSARGSIVDPSYLALVSDQSLRSTVIAGRPDLGKPDWREDVPGQPLTPQQISDVVAWLAGHRRPVPGRPVLSAGGG